jgi:hypothetical protein
MHMLSLRQAATFLVPTTWVTLKHCAQFCDNRRAQAALTSLACDAAEWHCSKYCSGFAAVSHTLLLALCKAQEACAWCIAVELIPCCLSQGYMVGNGCTDRDFDGNAQVPFALGKSLISTSLYKRVQAACRGNYWDVKEGSR